MPAPCSTPTAFDRLLAGRFLSGPSRVVLAVVGEVASSGVYSEPGPVRARLFDLVNYC